jgi:hypothetical protein
MSTLAARRKARRYVNVRIKLVDAESEIHKYRVSWTRDGHPFASIDKEEIVEFTPGDTVPLKQLLALVPEGYHIRALRIHAPTKLLPGASDELRGTLILNTYTANFPTRVMSSTARQLCVRVDSQRYWPVELAPLAQNLVSFGCVSRDATLKAPGLLLLYHLDQVVKHGLASSSPPATPWTLFLTRGLYDPRLLLQITAFLFQLA